MADFFDTVLKFLQSIGDFIHMIFDSFNSFTDILTTLVPNFRSDVINYIPTFCQPFIICALGILIIKAVLDII